MSKQRKHVEEEILFQYAEPKENERIVQVIESRGRNTLEVLYPNGDTILSLIPAKYHKKVWIKKGNFVIIEPTFLPDASSKVLAVVTRILYPNDIQNLINNDQWPNEFLSYALETLSLKNKQNETSDQKIYLNMDFMSDSDNDDLEWGHNPNHTKFIDDESSSEAYEEDE